MPLIVDVPLNTMLGDLDDSLRMLLRRELGNLYDLRESGEHRHRMIDERRAAGGVLETRPPLILSARTR